MIPVLLEAAVIVVSLEFQGGEEERLKSLKA